MMWFRPSYTQIYRHTFKSPWMPAKKIHQELCHRKTSTPFYTQSKWRVGSRRLAQWNLRPRWWVCSHSPHSPPPAVPSPPASPAAAASPMRCGFGWRWSSKKWEPAAAGSTNTSAAFRSFQKWPVKPTCAQSCWENGRNWEKNNPGKDNYWMWCQMHFWVPALFRSYTTPSL